MIKSSVKWIFFFFIKRFALPCIYQSNHIKILPLIYIVKKKGNSIIMNNIHDQGFFFFCIIIYIIYNEEKRKVQTYRVAIKLSTMSAILLYVVSVFSSYAKNTIYIVWHLSIVSWHRVMMYTPEFKQFWNEKNIADECLHPFWTVSNAKGAKCALALPFLSKSNYAWFVHMGYTD